MSTSAGELQLVGPRLLQPAVDAAQAAVELVRDPAVVPIGHALACYEAFEQLERAGAAGKALLARAVADSGAHRQRGFPTPADLLASVAGAGVGAARDELATSSSLGELPAVRDALVAGTISATQAQVIAGAGKVNPASQADLLRAASTANLRDLKDMALRAKRGADPSPEATEQRIHENRRCTNHTDAEGAAHIHAAGTPAGSSAFLNELGILTDQLFRERSGQGHREAISAHRFDALERMAVNSRCWRLGHARADRKRPRHDPPTHLALLRADIAALRRGRAEGDELCEIAGVGPVSVTKARELLGDAVLKIVLTDGVDVQNVTSLTRRPSQAVQFAMLWASPTCVAEGCSRTHTEWDHRTGHEWATTRHTRLDELDRLCDAHHDLHTRDGWALVPGPPGSKRPMVPPDDLRHPLHPEHRGRVAAPAAPAGPMATAAPVADRRGAPEADPFRPARSPAEPGGPVP